MTAADGTLEVMRRRRVVRQWSAEPLSRSDLRTTVRAALWAPVAGNRRLQRYVIVQHPRTIRLIRAVAPGLSHLPAAVVVICLDLDRAAQVGSLSEAWWRFDVGTAALSMLLAAQALGLGGGPVSSFSAEAVRVILRLPPGLLPVLLLPLGRPASAPSPRVLPDRPVRLNDLIIWERADHAPHRSDEGGAL